MSSRSRRTRAGPTSLRREVVRRGQRRRQGRLLRRPRLPHARAGRSASSARCRSGRRRRSCAISSTTRARCLVRADLIVQWEVARKRAVMPPSTLLSATWAPWWSLRGRPAHPGERLPSRAVGRRRRALRDAPRPTHPPAPHGRPVCLLRAPPVAVASAGHMEEEAWTVPDVYLLTEGAQGPVAVPHLTLTFREGGLELDKADGESVWDCDWSDLRGDGADRTVGPPRRQGGRRDRRHRTRPAPAPPFRPGDRRRRKRPRSRSEDGRGPRAAHPVAPSRGLTTADGRHRRRVQRVTLTLLLLSAVHVIRF